MQSWKPVLPCFTRTQDSLINSPPALSCPNQGKINKFAGLSRDLVGAKMLFIIIFVFFSFLKVEKKHINKVLPPKSRDKSREKFVYVFLSLCFLLPITPKIAIFCGRRSEKLAIFAAEWFRARLRPPWSLRFCDAIFVPLIREEKGT